MLKFSEIKSEEWLALQPYLDTCLLPLTQLTGEETPPEMTAALELLRDVLALIERPFNGRVVTYPALHFMQEDEQGEVFINQLCRKIKATGFRYVIIVSVTECHDINKFEEADLYIDLAYMEDRQRLTDAVERMWRGEDHT